MNPGDVIDIWVVEKQLGSGGMGSVYRCHNKTATRILAAVKTLDTALRKVAGAEERFIREAEILFRLDHPNIVKVRNVRTDTDPPYLEMEFVEGESLESLLDRGPIAIDKAIEFAIQLADAIGYLHEQGIRHRDIKPANVLIRGDGRLKLVDFGLAMEADLTRITQSGMTFGTVSYAPPEWAYPDTIDPVRWDVYAMGVVLWEMLTGKVAFPVSGQGSARQQAMQVILQKQNHPPLDPGPTFHDPLRALVREMTESRAEKRPNDANALGARLRTMERTLARTSAGDTIVAAHGLADSDPPGAGSLPEAAERGERSTWAPERGNTPGPVQRSATPVAADAGGGLQSAVAAHPSPATPEPTLAQRKPTPEPQRSSLKAPKSVETLHPGDDEQSTTARRAAVPLAIGFVGLVFVGGAVLVAGIAAAVFVMGGEAAPAERDVDVVVSGLPNGTPLALSLDGSRSSGNDAWVYHFADLPSGELEVKAAVGEGCEPCLTSECPAWCGLQASKATIEAGEGTQTVALALDPPAPRALKVTSPGWPDATVALAVGGKPVSELAPGRYTVEASSGEARWTGEIVVPWGSGEAAVEVPLEKPTTAAVGAPKTEPKSTVPKATPVKAAVTDVGKSDPPAAGGAAGKIVSNGQFAKWLAANPDWQKDAAIGASRADGSYLAGWTDTTPPPGTDGLPMTSASWYAAAAYCASRGGLAMVDAAPTTWAESASQPGLEWRSLDGKKAAFLMSDGTSGQQAQKSQVTSFTGFRCAK